MRYVLLFVVVLVVAFLWMQKGKSVDVLTDAVGEIFISSDSELYNEALENDLTKWQLQTMQNDLSFWHNQVIQEKELADFNAGKTFGADGFNVYGLDREGYNREGWDKDGFNRQKVDWFGNKKSDSFINKTGCDPKVCNGYGDHWTEVRLAMDGTCYYYDITDSILNFKAVYRLPCAKNNLRLGKKYEPIFGIHTPI